MFLSPINVSPQQNKGGGGVSSVEDLKKNAVYSVPPVSFFMTIVLCEMLCPGSRPLSLLREWMVSSLWEQSALPRAQGKQNRTKCLSTVPTSAFCLQ